MIRIEYIDGIQIELRSLDCALSEDLFEADIISAIQI
jgi:hypothetical protein